MPTVSIAPATRRVGVSASVDTTSASTGER
jgi:hypothetical protein